MQVVDEIGHGGLCQIYKIRKRDEKVGGSSRPRLRRRKMLSLDYRSAQKEFFRKPFPGLHEVVAPPQHSLEYALKVINLKLVKGGSEKINQLQVCETRNGFWASDVKESLRITVFLLFASTRLLVPTSKSFSTLGI